ncbi:MAG: 2Fe-2S iron-sulfur cluster-binding protein [Gammaproteobacteria bacterium]
MSTVPGGLYHPYDRLVKIKVLGKTAEVPENNILLRAFQFISPETVPYGRFCWNEECQYCRVTIIGLDGKEHRVLSCKVLVRDGMEIIWMDQELHMLLKKALGLD